MTQRTYTPATTRTATSALLLLTTACSLLLPSCSETVDEPGGTPDGPAAMTFSAREAAGGWGQAETRALINTSMIEREGTILRLADIVTETDGTRHPHFGITNPDDPNHGSQQGTDLFRYSQYKGGYDWLRYRNPGDYGGHYYWTETGTHKFFGWARGVKLEPDDQGNTDASQMFSDYHLHIQDNPSTLEIDETELHSETTPQFDFVYTDVITRNIDNPAQSYPQTDDYTVRGTRIPLTFHHLLAALALTVQNQSTQPLIITGLTMTGLKTNSTARIRFNDPTAAAPNPEVLIPDRIETTPKPQTEIQGGFIQATVAGSVPARTGSAEPYTYSSLDVFSAADADGHRQLLNGDPATRLFWPQAAPTVTFTLRYKTSDADADERTKTVSVDLATMTANGEPLKAGQKYRLNLVFKGDAVPLTCTLTVLPWDTEERTMDIKIAVADNGALSFSYTDPQTSQSVTPTATDVAGDTPYKRIDMPATLSRPYLRLSFTPTAPEGGTWTCNLEESGGAFALFRVEDGETFDAKLNEVWTRVSAQNYEATADDQRITGTITATEQTFYLVPTGLATDATIPTGTEANCRLSFGIITGDVQALANDQYQGENYKVFYTKQ